MQDSSARHNPETTKLAETAGGCDPNPDALRGLVLALCVARGAGKSICPSEVARTAGGDPSDGARWRPLMRAVRAAAATLQEEGRIVVLRKGRPVDIRIAKGVIRLALPDDRWTRQAP